MLSYLRCSLIWNRIHPTKVPSNILVLNLVCPLLSKDNRISLSFLFWWFLFFSQDHFDFAFINMMHNKYIVNPISTFYKGLWMVDFIRIEDDDRISLNNCKNKKIYIRKGIQCLKESDFMIQTWAYDVWS